MSLNQFDFRYIQVRSTRKRDLLNGGINPNTIRSEQSWVQTPKGRYPRRHYVATVQHFNANDDSVPDQAAKEWQDKCPKAIVSIRYHCSD